MSRSCKPATETVTLVAAITVIALCSFARAAGMVMCFAPTLVDGALIATIPAAAENSELPVAVLASTM